MTQDTRDHRCLGQGGNDPERAASAQGTGGHIQVTHTPQQSCPAPARCPRVGLMPIHTLWARRRRDRTAPAAVRRHTAPLPHQVNPRQGHQGCQLFQEFQRRDGDPRRAVCPGRGEGIHEIPVGVLCTTRKRHRTPGRRAEQALQLIPPMGWDPGCLHGAKTR